MNEDSFEKKIDILFFFYFRCHWPNFFWLYWFWFSLWYLWYLLYMKAEKSLSLERNPFEWRYFPVKWVLAWTCYCIRLHAWTTILDCMRLGLDLELMRLRALCITEYLHQHIVASLMILTFGQYVRKSQFHSNFTTKHLLALSPGLRIIAQKWIKKKVLGKNPPSQIILAWGLRPETIVCYYKNLINF